MQMRVAYESNASDKELVLPEAIRARTGLRGGDVLEVHVESTNDSNRIILSFPKISKPEGQIIADPLSGWPVLDFGPDAPELTNEQVLEMLAEFP